MPLLNCTTCPQEVVNVVVNQVSDILQRVQEIEELTRNFNAAFLQMLVNRVTDDLQAWVNAIPTPPVVNLTDIIAYLTCPLTPFLFRIDITNNEAGKPVSARVYIPPEVLANTPPAQLYYSITQQYNQTAINVNAAYVRSTQTVDTALPYGSKSSPAPTYQNVLRDANGNKITLQSGFLIQFMQYYLREIHNAMGDPFQFGTNLAMATGTVAYVARTCPTLYNNPNYPFLAFTETMTTFTFDGFLPNGLDPSVLPVLNLVVEAETKILGWKTFLTLAV